MRLSHTNHLLFNALDTMFTISMLLSGKPMPIMVRDNHDNKCIHSSSSNKALYLARNQLSSTLLFELLNILIQVSIQVIDCLMISVVSPVVVIKSRIQPRKSSLYLLKSSYSSPPHHSCKLSMFITANLLSRLNISPNLGNTPLTPKPFFNLTK